VRARPLAKVRPIPLFVVFSLGSADPVSISGPGVQLPRNHGHQST
jgi:hypothetical protein